MCALPEAGRTAPYAALVMDARTGEVLHARNADTRLHPASLTKMLTLYIAFEAVRLGEITMDTPVTISRNAANTPYAIGFRAGSSVQLRYLVRAAAVRSSNDGATAIAEAIEGSVPAFAERMNRTAAALGMANSTFVNPHGLTAAGHRSTARDMSLMGRRLFFDYPQYYNIFGRRSTNAGIATVYNTNRRFLNAYEGADGIKTGYTNAAGFNLTASARRGSVRIIATVFGGQSTAWRNRRMAELLDMGFARAPSSAPTRQPALPTYDNQRPGPIHSPTGAVAVSLIPVPRPARGADPVLLAAIEEAVDEAMAAEPEDIAEVATDTAENVADLTEEVVAALTDPTEELAEVEPEAIETVVAEVVQTLETTIATRSPAIDPPPARPADLVAEAPSTDPSEDIAEAPEGEILEAASEQLAEIDLAANDEAPQDIPAPAAAEPAPAITPRPIAVAEQPAEEIVISRNGSSGARGYGVSLGRYPSAQAAERLLLQTALGQGTGLHAAERQVSQRPGGFEARFTGLTQREADLACARLMVQNVICSTFGGG